jgi:hypothetical protein
MLVPHGSNLNYNQENISSPKGRQQEIACLSWMTATGAVMPVMFKIMGENEEIHTFNRIRVNFSEKKIYCGIPSFEYNCDVPVNGINMNLTLQFFPEHCKWYLYEKTPKAFVSSTSPA